jgi:hypothetical protein
MTVHDLRLLLAQEDVDAAFDGLNYDHLQAQKQNVNERCSMQCELAHAERKLDGNRHQRPAPQCEEETSPRRSIEEPHPVSP